MSDAVDAIIDRLIEVFPTCFNRDAPKPLKIGIYPELRARAKQQPALATVPPEALRQALQAYTQSPAYQRALAQGGPRYDLNGHPAGEVTPAHQAYAALPPEQRQPKKKSTSVAPPTTPLLELTALLPELLAMAIPGKLDVTLKINQLPQVKPTAAQTVLFAVQAEGRTVVVELKTKTWNTLKTAAETYPQWVAAITGKLGEAIEGGFRLENPTVQVFEKKAKPDVATPPPPASKAPAL